MTTSEQLEVEKKIAEAVGKVKAQLRKFVAFLIAALVLVSITIIVLSNVVADLKVAWANEIYLDSQRHPFGIWIGINPENQKIIGVRNSSRWKVDDLAIDVKRQTDTNTNLSANWNITLRTLQ